MVPRPKPPTRTSRQGNPTDSPFYSLPDASRGRPSLKLTPAPETTEGIRTLAEAWGLNPDRDKSKVVDRLVTEALAKLKPRGK